MCVTSFVFGTHDMAAFVTSYTVQEDLTQKKQQRSTITSAAAAA